MILDCIPFYGSNFKEESLSTDVYVPLVGEKMQGIKRKTNPTYEEMTKFSNEQKKKKIDGNLKEFLSESKLLEGERYGNIC